MNAVTVPVEPSATWRAPHVALRFSPDGHVHAWCVNDLYSLGRIGAQTIREIWEGAPLASLRAALDRGDYASGCQDCETDHRQGRREQTHAEQFDRFAQPVAPPAWPKRVEFALSNTCNLQCVHCNGDLSSAIRAQREHRPALRSPYDDAFFEDLRDLLPHVEVAVFIGGEPFLARECRRVWDLLIELDLHPEVHVTTNGTVWDDGVEHYVHALRMNVAVLIDGASGGVNDAIRLGVPVHVIAVHFPSFASLFGLPAEGLGPFVAAMESSATAAGLVRNRPAWEETVSHLQARLAQLDGGTAVGVRTGPTERPDRRLVDAICEELAVWSGQEPLTIRSPYGLVDELEVPPWAEPLALEVFVGRSRDDLDEAMTALLGARADLRTEPGGEGFTWLSYSHHLSGGVVHFRTAVVPCWGVITGTMATTLPVAG